MSNKSASFHEIGVLGPYLFYDITDGQELRGKKFRCIVSYNEREAEAVVELLRFKKKGGPRGRYIPLLEQLIQVHL